MSINCLNEQQQDTVAVLYTDEQNPLNQIEIAEYFGVSRRTIQRVLEARGIKSYNYGSKTPRVTHKVTSRPIQQPLELVTPTPNRVKEDGDIVALVRAKGLNLESLEKALNAPQITRANVTLYLTELPTQELANLAYTVGLVKVSQIHRESVAQAKQKEAANG